MAGWSCCWCCPMAVSRWSRQRGPAWEMAVARRAVMCRRPRRRWAGWETCWPRACWFRLFPDAARPAGSRLHGSHRPRRTPVQPVQLSLLPDLVPAPPVMLLAQLPDVHVAAAVMVLAGPITRAAALDAATRAGDRDRGGGLCGYARLQPVGGDQLPADDRHHHRARPRSGQALWQGAARR